MIYYVIKDVALVTQAQLNASGVRKTSNLRTSKNGIKCILKFDDANTQYFINEPWLTVEEARIELLGPDWDPNALSLFQKALGFIGL